MPARALRTPPVVALLVPLALACNGGGDDPPPGSGTFTPEEATLRAFAGVSVGDQTTCGLDTEGTVRCWGNDNHGQGTVPPLNAPSTVAVGRRHTCALGGNGLVSCWGDVDDGRLDVPVQFSWKGIDVGGHHACGVTNEDTVRCWGRDDHLQVRGRPEGGSFQAVAVGDDHSCALATDGTVGCWGSAGAGRLDAPSGTFTAIAAGAGHTCALDAGGAVSCWGVDTDGQATPPSGTFTALAAGREHTCGLAGDGEITCWGRDAAGRLDVPAGPFVGLDAGGGTTCAWTAEGQLACWGANHQGQGMHPDAVLATAAQFVAPPAAFADEASGGVFVWPEQKRRALDGSQEVLLGGPGTLSGVTPPTTRTLDAGARVSSWYVHRGGSDGEVAVLRFPGQILGVLVTPETLDATDARLGAEGTAYPSGRADRGSVVGGDDERSDRITIRPDGATLEVAFSGGGLDGLRVLTGDAAGLDLAYEMTIREEAVLGLACTCEPDEVAAWATAEDCEIGSGLLDRDVCAEVAWIEAAGLVEDWLACRTDAARDARSCYDGETCPLEGPDVDDCGPPYEADLADCDADHPGASEAWFDALATCTLGAKGGCDDVDGPFLDGDDGQLAFRLSMAEQGDDHTPPTECAPDAAPAPDRSFRWRPPQPGIWRLSTEGSDLDTVLWATTGCEGEVLACNDDHEEGVSWSAIEVTVQAGEWVRIVIDGTDTLAGGDLDLAVEAVELFDVETGDTGDPGDTGDTGAP